VGSEVDRNRARRLIGGVFDEAVDDIATDRLEAMKRQVEAQMQTARTKGLYSKMDEALGVELQARREAAVK
jgi:hypothetical protein